MPQLASIVINDGQATPVAHTFNPSGPDENGTSYLYDRSGGIAVCFPELAMSLRSPMRGAKDRNYRARVAIRVPTPDITSPSTGTGIQPAPSKAYDTLVTMDFILPERCTLQNRKDVLAFAKNILTNATVTALVQDLESIY